MKANHLAILALRLLAIYCFVQAVPLLGTLSSIFVLARQGREFIGGVLALSLAPGLCYLVMGIVLLANSKTLGDKLAPADAGEADAAHLSFEQLPAVAFAVAGVLIFADALPRLFNSLLYLPIILKRAFENEPSLPDSGTFQLHEALTALGTVAQAALGLLLFFRARGLASFWRLLRTAGTPKPPTAGPAAQSPEDQRPVDTSPT